MSRGRACSWQSLSRASDGSEQWPSNVSPRGWWERVPSPVPDPLTQVGRPGCCWPGPCLRHAALNSRSVPDCRPGGISSVFTHEVHGTVSHTEPRQAAP